MSHLIRVMPCRYSQDSQDTSSLIRLLLSLPGELFLTVSVRSSPRTVLQFAIFLRLEDDSQQVLRCIRHKVAVPIRFFNVAQLHDTEGSQGPLRDETVCLHFDAHSHSHSGQRSCR